MGKINKKNMYTYYSDSKKCIHYNKNEKLKLWLDYDPLIKIKLIQEVNQTEGSLTQQDDSR